VLKQFSHKVGSIILAFIVLFSSFSFTIHKHMCGDVLVTTSYFVEADSCEMAVNKCENECEDENSNAILENNEHEFCCNDLVESIQGNDNNQQARESLELSQVQFLVAYVASYKTLLNEAQITPVFNEYSPPLVVKDIQVLHDTFLI